MNAASHRQFPLFDSLRALAALSVLLVHVAIFTDAFGADGLGPILAHLDIGVPFFFLLSAFLLYRPFVAARVLGSPRPGIPDYAARRATRILPAYWLALTVAALVPGMVGIFTGDWWAYYGLLQIYPVHEAGPECVAEPLRCGLPQTWSLAVEVAFYAVLPLYALALDRLARRFGGGRWVGVELGAVALIGGASIVIQASVPTSDAHLWLFFSPLGRGLWFGLGLALAALSVRAEQLGSEPPAVRWLRAHPGPPIVLALALFVASCLLVFEPTPTLAFPVVGTGEYLLQYVLFGVIAALVLLPAAFAADGPGLARAFLRHRVLAWLGLVSYGIFLWQFPVIVALTDLGINDVWPAMDTLVLLLAALPITVACAAISFYALERPLMRRVRAWRTRSAEPAGIAGADDVAGAP